MKALAILAASLALLCLTPHVQAQEMFTGDTLKVRFDNWTGLGFSSDTTGGRLDSRSWIVTGLSDGAMDFGDTKIGGDYGRGMSSGRVTTGGVYSFTPASGVRLLGFQPTGTDLSPGSVTLRVRLAEAISTQSIVVSYSMWSYNDQGRSTLIEMDWSKDGVDFYPATGGSTMTPVMAEIAVQWRKETVSGILPVGDLQPDDLFFVRWTMRDGSGTGSRDEWGLEEIKIFAGDGDPVDPTPEAVTLIKYDFDDDTDVPSIRTLDQFDASFRLTGANRTGYATGSPGRSANSSGWTELNSAWYLRLSTVGFEGVAVQSSQYSSSTGPKFFSLDWSSDSISWKHLHMIEVGSSFSQLQPDRGVYLPAEAENLPKLWLRWRLAGTMSVDGGEIRTSGTSRIDEIAITGIQTSPMPPAFSQVSIASQDDRIVGFFELSSNGTALIEAVNLNCSRSDGDSLIIKPLPIAVRSTVPFQTGILPQPSTWECRVTAESDDGSAESDLFQVQIDPPPPPYADKPGVQASNITLFARTDSSMQVKWDRGDGQFSLLAVLPDGVTACETDTSVTYTMHPNVLLGGLTKNGCRVVHNGIGNHGVIYGIDPLQELSLTVIEYNGNPGRENYLEQDQEVAVFQTRARVPDPITDFIAQVVTFDDVTFTWTPPPSGDVLVLLADAPPLTADILAYLDHDMTDGKFNVLGCSSSPCTVQRDVIGDRIVFAMSVNGPKGNQSVQSAPISQWVPIWPDPSFGMVLAEWDFNMESNDPSWSVWEHQHASVQVAGARDRGYASGHTGLSSYTDQWHEPDLSKSWSIEMTTHGLTSAAVEFRIISSASGPARFRVLCDVNEKIFESEGFAEAASSWAASQLQRLDIPSKCLQQPRVVMMITPSEDVALNGNHISRSGTSRLDDLRFYGIFDDGAKPLLADLHLLANNDDGVLLAGRWISAVGKLPTKQVLSLKSDDHHVELNSDVNDLLAQFHISDLKAATEYQVSHCGFVGDVSSCSNILALMTPFATPTSPSVTHFQVVEPDSVHMFVHAHGNDVVIMYAPKGVHEPVLSDSVGVDQLEDTVYRYLPRTSAEVPITIGGLRPGGEYRIWAVTVAGPDAVSRYARPPYPYIDVQMPRLEAPVGPAIALKQLDVNLSSISFQVTEPDHVSLLYTLTPQGSSPTAPLDDVDYTPGILFNQGDRISESTYVIGGTTNGVLTIRGLPLDQRWVLRIYAIKTLHGSIVYSTDFAEHLFATLPDPAANPMIAHDVWNASLGDTVLTSGRVLSVDDDDIILHLDGGNLRFKDPLKRLNLSHLLQKVALVGLKKGGGIEILDFFVTDEDVMVTGDPIVVHPDSSNQSLFTHSQVVIGNLLQSDDICEDGSPKYRQRGHSTRTVCILGIAAIPEKGVPVQEWAVTAIPMFDPASSHLRIYTTSKDDIVRYVPASSVLLSPNVDQLITWTSKDDVDVEFRWRITEATRPFDHFPDSVAYHARFLTRSPNQRTVKDVNLSNGEVSLTYKASELHRSHNVTDSLALNTVIQWTVALTPVFGTSTEEQELDNWATFQLVRLKALHETDVMDIPTRFMLEPARPNPFNPSTSLRIHIPNASHLSLMVFDIIGRPVNTIHEGSISAGVHDLDWNAGRLSSGIYIVRARLEGTVLTQSVTLLK